MRIRGTGNPFRNSPPRALAFALPALLTLLAFWALDPGVVHVNRSAIDDGERLYQLDTSVPPSGNALPMGPVLTALLENHFTPAQRNFALRALLLCCVSLVFALGARLGSSRCGLLAALGAVVYFRSADALYLLDMELVLYAAAVLLALLAWTARWRSAARASAALGVAVGAGLLVRTPLFAFPAFALVYECLAARPRSKFIFIRERWALPAVPLIILLPWLWLNLSARGEPVLLDRSRADSNVIAGALGLVGTIEGDAYALAAIPRNRVNRWAVGEVLRHPARYAAACLRRLAFAAGLHPILFTMALAAFWRLRRREGARRAATLAAYYLVIHCLLAVEGRYFIPLWLLLLPAAATWLDAIWAPPREAPADGPIKAAVGASAGAYAAFSVYVIALVIRYASATGRNFSYEEALKTRPADAWLWNQLGRAHLERGELGPAQAALETAQALNPSVERRFDAILALLAGGRPGSALPGSEGIAAFLASREAGYPGRLILMLTHLREGDRAAARRDYDEARALWRDTASMFRVVATLHDLELLERLRRGDSGFEAALETLLLKLPFNLRIEFVDRLQGIDVRSQTATVATHWGHGVDALNDTLK